MSRMTALAEKFDPLTQRERGLIAVAIWVVLGMMGYLVLESVILEYQKANKSVQQIHKDNALSVQQIDLYQQRLNIDPNTDVLARQAQIAQQTQEVEQQLKTQMVDMVPAEYMPQLLSSLLSKVNGIQLQSFASIPPVPLIEVGEAEKLNLYSHGIKLVLEGDYFTILRFIQAAEAMPDKMYWKRMDYQVSTHPKSQVELEIYTLSINEGFISVAAQE